MKNVAAMKNAQKERLAANDLECMAENFIFPAQLQESIRCLFDDEHFNWHIGGNKFEAELVEQGLF